MSYYPSMAQQSVAAQQPQQQYTNQAHLYQPQIAPWTPYMRRPVGAAVPATTAVQPVITTPQPAPLVVNTNTTTNATQHTKRHNPYAASTSENSSALTSPALGYTAATHNSNPSFDRLPSNSYPIQQQPQQLQQQQQRPDRSGQSRTITADDVRSQMGSLLDLAHTANGSAFLQSAIRGGSAVTDTRECIELISTELLPHLGDLLLDSHGCYIIKTLMERMPTAQLQHVMVSQIAPDESLVYSLCTHSLHTRRVVQFLLDTIDCTPLIGTIATRCSEIATTQQGCIVVQRAMDVAVGAQRARLFAAIQSHFATFCSDPFANYVLQHMFSVGDATEIGRSIWPRVKGNVVALSCNKFASNVVEKCLSCLPSDLQHELLTEMYDVPEESLLAMLQDSFGNYIIQSSISLAAQRDIPFMRAKLMAVLDRTPYGHKIESRLERRRKGNSSKGSANEGPAAADAGHSGSTSSAPSTSHAHSQSRHGKSNNSNGESRHPSNGYKGHRNGQHKVAPLVPVAPVAEGEEPW